ncbi:MAG: cytochrome c3 family protein [Candidatus Aquicultorales bacterium]
MFARRGTDEHSRVLPYLPALLILTFGIVLGVSLIAGGAGAPAGLSFSTASPISASQCAACHGNPGDFKNDRLIFKHAAHITYACSICHLEFPHSQDGLKKPQMDLCFSCHGLNHGVQGAIAGSKCDTCHPGTAPKIPSTHTAAWKTSQHKDVPADKLRTCGMCHRPTMCKDCHEANGIKGYTDVKTFVFETITPAKPQPGSLFSVSDLVSMAQCTFCHPNIDGFKNPKLIFKHDIHLVRNVSCDRCHTAFPHGAGTTKTQKPPMELCYGCHGVSHSGVEVATVECKACHPAGMNLVPATHTEAFKTKNHPKDVKNNLKMCEMCHQAAFCRECHTANTIIAKNHGMGKDDNKEVRTKWRKVHGKESTAKDDCGVCHSKQYCADCHKTEIPHAVTWLGTHGKLSKNKERECNKCHQTETSCQECHHGDVKSSRLTKENCIRCHDLYIYNFKTIYGQAQTEKALKGALSPEDSRFYRGYSVHAAHFEMTNTNPFACERCHGDKIKQGAQYYSFRILCARCHGAYQNGKLIAKFDIPELCFRCHTDMKGLIGP